jgi:plastocyanin domain-containing protein
LLGLIGFGVWWFLKKRKAKPAEPEEDADEI